MASEQTSSGKTPLSPDLNFVDFALAQDAGADGEDSPIVFFCKDCQKLTEVEKIGKSLKFQCKKCKGKKISFGTKASLEKFYKI